MSDYNYKKQKEQKEQDIINNPEKHRHTYDELNNCCISPDGAIDLYIMDLHSKYCNIGTNGNSKCDVIEGPCSCRAWH